MRSPTVAAPTDERRTRFIRMGHGWRQRSWLAALYDGATIADPLYWRDGYPQRPNADYESSYLRLCTQIVSRGYALHYTHAYPHEPWKRSVRLMRGEVMDR